MGSGRGSSFGEVVSAISGEDGISHFEDLGALVVGRADRGDLVDLFLAGVTLRATPRVCSRRAMVGLLEDNFLGVEMCSRSTGPVNMSSSSSMPHSCCVRRRFVKSGVSESLSVSLGLRGFGEIPPRFLALFIP